MNDIETQNEGEEVSLAYEEDLSGVDESVSFKIPSEGTHDAVIHNVTGHMKNETIKPWLHLRIFGGDDDGLEFISFESMPYPGESEASKGRRKRIWRACGFDPDSATNWDFRELKGHAVTITVKHELYEGKVNAKVKGWAAYEGNDAPELADEPEEAPAPKKTVKPGMKATPGAPKNGAKGHQTPGKPKPGAVTKKK